MIGTALHWIDGPWKGQIALAARPRGGEWLQDEMAYWHQCGVDIVVSLLEPDEERDLDLQGEAALATAAGLTFRSLPLQDRGIPASDNELRGELEFLTRELLRGKSAVLHCRQGIGRTGLVAASLLLTAGWNVASALKALREARGISMPETKEQSDWIYGFAGSLASAR